MRPSKIIVGGAMGGQNPPHFGGAMGGQNRPIVSFFDVLTPQMGGVTKMGGVCGGETQIWSDYGGVTSKIMGGQPESGPTPPYDGGAKFC